MKNFVIIITYNDNTVKNQYFYGTIEQASKAVEAYRAVPSVKTVILQYK